MAESDKRTGGSLTPRYKIIRSKFYTLAVSCEQVLPQLTTLSFEKELLSKNDMQELSVSGQTVFEKSKSFLERILKKIEIDQKWYDVFLSVTQNFTELGDIAKDIEKELLQENGFVSETKRRTRKIKTRSSSANPTRKTLLPPIQEQVPPHLRRFSVDGNSSPELRIKPLENVLSQDLNLQSASGLQIDKLQKDLADSKAKIKQLEIALAEKDKVISELERDQNEKNKELSKKEQMIADLKARCKKAENKQAENEEKYKAQIEELQKTIEELKSEESATQFELREARLKMGEVKLSFREEIQAKTKIQFEMEQSFKEEIQAKKKIQFEMEQRIHILEVEKEKNALKFTIAERDKELAKAKKEIAEKELAIKMAQEKEQKLSDELQAKLVI